MARSVATSQSKSPQLPLNCSSHAGAGRKVTYGFASILRIAIRALARNKMRSVLTMLGIIIGVGAVIAMVGVGQGARPDRCKTRSRPWAPICLFVSSGSVNRGGLNAGLGRNQDPGGDYDAKAIAARMPCGGRGRARQLRRRRRSSTETITGRHRSPAPSRNTSTFAPGRFQRRRVFTEDDVTNAANVAVLGETVRKNLFGTTDPDRQDDSHRKSSVQGRGRARCQRAAPAWARIRTTSSSSRSPPCRKRLPDGLAALHHGVGRVTRRQLRRAAADHGVAARPAPHSPGAGRRLHRSQPR